MSPAASRQTVDGHQGILVAHSENPTRTQTVEERYARKLRGRYQDINSLIREFVGRRDVLGLGELTAAGPPPNFEFSRDDQKIEGFREWLMQAQRDEVLDVVDRNENRYVRQAFATGMRGANTDIRQADAGSPLPNVSASLRLGVHEQVLQVLYTRNFNELDGLTSEIGREVARELTQAVGEGTGPREAGRRITDIIGTVEDGTPRGAQARATTIARTETLRARHLGAREQYKRHGVELVEPILAPTACELCVQLAAGAPYPVEEMGAHLPQHPNCRCSWTLYRGGEAVTASHGHGVPGARRVSIRTGTA